MSNVVPNGHRHTRSAAMPPSSASPQNPQNPHHLNLQAHALNSQAEMNLSTHPSTPPQTPQKSRPRNNQNKSTSTAPETGTKQKPRNKRPKNVTTSPAVTRNDRNTSPSMGMPSSSKPVSTPSTAAYAGPTFHASPAPSALPIPSFYSKSVPESPGIKGIKSLKDASLSGSPTPALPISNAQFQREESPLDVFFRADREEKARARSASSTQTAVAATGPFQPPSTSPRTSQTPPAITSQARPRHTNRASSSGMFTMELDGPGTPYGPAFSTPYSERISAARSSHASPQLPLQDAQKTATSEALKAYLFSDSQTSLPTPPSANHFRLNENTASVPVAYRKGCAASHPQKNSFSYALDPKAPGRSSGLRQEVTPTRTPTKASDVDMNYSPSPTPSRIYRPSDTSDFVGRISQPAASLDHGSSYGVVTPENKSSDLKGMEDSLRKMLKLDSARTSGSAASDIGNVSSASTSVPTYAGGRPPPMNGMHNGVMGS